MIASCNHCFQYLPRRHFIKVEGFNDEEKIVMYAAIRCNGVYRHGYSGVGVGDTDYSRDK